MAPNSRRRRSRRIRIGNVSVYEHHGSWWIYFRENGKPIRRRVGEDPDEAKAVGARVNAQLAATQPTLFSFEAVSVRDLVGRWLGHHEHVLRSSVATCNRYRTAADHLIEFTDEAHPSAHAHEINAERLVAHLRTVQVAPNGHPNTRRRRLSDKGVKFILGTCRAMYNYAARLRLLPPYFDNPFAVLPIERLPIEDAKPIHVFAADEEADFLAACDDWQFPLFYLLAKIGLRSGELTHLLVEDVDLDDGVLHVRNKPDLGWSVKTRNVRSIPLPTEPMAVIRSVVHDRETGILFMRPAFAGRDLAMAGATQKELADEAASRESALDKRLGRAPTRSEQARVARVVWRDAGAIKTDKIRIAFMKVTRQIGLPEVTAPKCWRHTFATLMQEAGVDPLIRQLTMGHVPAGAGRGALGMTATYTHTPPEVHRAQLQRVIDLRPRTSELVQHYVQGREVGREADHA